MPLKSGSEDFERNWSFHIGELGETEFSTIDPSSYEKVRLPHTFNSGDTFDQSRGYYRGPAWYLKEFDTCHEPGNRYYLRFHRTWGSSRIWLNDVYQGEYYQGLSGFEIEVTDDIKRGRNVLAVRIDNSHQAGLLPGKTIPDYNVYGGLCGNVQLVSKPGEHLAWRSVFFRSLDPNHPEKLSIDLEIARDGDHEGDSAIQVSICDQDGEAVVENTHPIQSGKNHVHLVEEIPSPSLWSPDSPYLYEARIRLMKEGQTIDQETVSFGIRHFHFDSQNGFKLNGKRVQLRGVNRHEDFPGLGNVLPARFNNADAEIIKDLGGNFVRTSHYPQSPSFLEACDRLGIMVYEEITTWQFIGGKDFLKSADRIMDSMVRRDRNHPSVILWGMMNEGRSPKLLRQLRTTGKKLDPTRPTIYADNKLDEGGYLGTISMPDVLGINYSLDEIEDFHEDHPEIRLLVSEHTNADGTKRGCSEAEKEQARRISEDLDIIESRPFIAGSTLWSMHDYGTDYEPVWPIQKSGILDIYRNPKEAYHMLRARWSETPVLHLASDWNNAHQEGEMVEVRVYTNCETIQLFLGGGPVGEKKGANPQIWQVPFRDAELKVIGINDGVEPVSRSIILPGEPEKIELTSPRKIRSDGEDCILLEARVTDGEGIMVPDHRFNIYFECDGPGRIIGIGNARMVPTVDGIANIVLSSDIKRGEIVVTASSHGLKKAMRKVEAY